MRSHSFKPYPLMTAMAMKRVAITDSGSQLEVIDMRSIRWAVVGLVCLLAGIVHAQTRLVSVELKNGCTLDMPVRFDTASIAVGTQELSPASCPATGLFTGTVSIGMVIRVNFTDGARDYLSIRTGKVKEGRFEYSLIQNLGPYQGLTWEDSIGKTNTIELPRLQSTGGVSGAKLQLTSVASANGVPAFDKSALDLLAQRVAEWNRGPEALIKRYTAEAESRFSSASNAHQQDHGKRIGGGARGGD